VVISTRYKRFVAQASYSEMSTIHVRGGSCPKVLNGEQGSDSTQGRLDGGGRASGAPSQPTN